MLKKAFKIISVVPTILLATLFIYACAAVPKLSKVEKETINEVLKNPLPEIIRGETGFAQSGTYAIWYERILPKSAKKGSVLLIMGHGNDALSWPPKFISEFVNAGYEVIRFDHRGTGLSTSTEKWKKKDAYSLSDMSGDAIAILKTLQLKKVHLVGVSMGGMIAQLTAIDHPDSIQSLTLIMTTGDIADEELSPMSEDLLPQMISAVLKHGVFGGKKGKMKLQVIQRKILMGEAKSNIDVREMAETSRYNLEKRDGYHFITARHHQQAILSSNSRNKALENIQIPTLIVHGEQDPVIPITHGKKLANTIPNANTLWVDDMGHDLPDASIPKICMVMLSHFDRSF